MDLSVLKSQLADFGTFVENTAKIFKNLDLAMGNATLLLDLDTWTGFFEGSSDLTSSVFKDGALSSEIKN